MGKRTPIRLRLSHSPLANAFDAWCIDIESHQDFIVSLSKGLDPFAAPDQVLRSLPDPCSWVCLGRAFIWRFPCGCLLSINLA